MAISLKQKKAEKVEEEWIWVEGYKGTDKNMQCNDYQYELGKQHDMPDNVKIEMCRNGFHFCKRLYHVFNYYEIGGGNRFFKVKALVRKIDAECTDPFYNYANVSDKLVAKSIIFERELTVNEIFDAVYTELHRIPGGWTDELKLKAINDSIPNAILYAQVNYLTSLGYSRELANYIIKDSCKYDLAVALGTQIDISMDTRIKVIFSNNYKPEPVMKPLF